MWWRRSRIGIYDSLKSSVFSREGNVAEKSASGRGGNSEFW